MKPCNCSFENGMQDLIYRHCSLRLCKSVCGVSGLVFLAGEEKETAASRAEREVSITAANVAACLQLPSSLTLCMIWVMNPVVSFAWANKVQMLISMHCCVVSVSSVVSSLPKGQWNLAYALSGNQMCRSFLQQRESGMLPARPCMETLLSQLTCSPPLPALTYSGFPMCLTATFVPVAVMNI